MSEIIKQYKKQFGEVLKPLGFKLYKRTFYRVINCIIQTLMLVRTETTCSIDFDIIPLAMGIEDLYCEGYSISGFREDMNRQGNWELEPSTHYLQSEDGTFEKVKVDDGDAGGIVKNMLSVVTTHVIPIFERGADANSAYAELVKIEKMIYTGIPGGISSHYTLALLCIRAQEYQKAYDHMANIIKKWDKAYEHKLAEREKRGELEKPSRLFDSFILEYNMFKELFYRLSAPDVEYLQNFIAEKEAISIENLRHPKYPGQRR